ncbi:ornithine cyclodeaminase family protein [Aquabacter sp. L1I39]|uniref:ornithine cyclodeaminase family protein n=1 Tax=Aquabacter sp. L1I39 TaxID=2820278 RepID=UPI001ADB75D3|nr:ornithine cyclodeaminase family protein [Aquabacter sp. L1I39]QTL04980.1 ornithine cyclodeaminase family protein [Aquabacter sp. L1I39]
MPRMFGAEEVEAALTYPRLVEALRAAFQEEGEKMPVRQSYPVGTEAAPGHLLLMPAWKRGTAIGTKLVTVFPGNAARGLGSVASLYVLMDGETGQPRAIIEGDALTNRRTAAASALASSYLSRPDSRTLAIIGTGHVAAHLMEAHCAIRPIDRILVFGRNRERAAALVERARTYLKVQTEVASDLAAMVGAADIVACGTTSVEPLVRGALVRPGTHVDLVGAFTPAMRESDDALIARADIYVDTRAGALAEAGDLLQPIAAGAWSADRLKGDLHDLTAGRVPGRTDAAAITVFKSVGAALEDLVAAQLLVDTGTPPLRAAS